MACRPRDRITRGTSININSEYNQYTVWSSERRWGALPGMKLRRTLAQNLRRLRQDRGLTQEELADLAALNRNYVGMIEREENSASVDKLEALAKALKVEPASLLTKQ
jgi:ribosome-binding protein aMBF1 (putative translation factor)